MITTVYHHDMFLIKQIPFHHIKVSCQLWLSLVQNMQTMEVKCSKSPRKINDHYEEFRKRTKMRLHTSEYSWKSYAEASMATLTGCFATAAIKASSLYDSTSTYSSIVTVFSSPCCPKKKHPRFRNKQYPNIKINKNEPTNMKTT